MMKKIKCLYLRSGTSKGPFFDLRDLPSDPVERDRVLLRIMGSPHPKQVDGIGGATSITSKVVMAQPSDRAGIDIDYLFAQVLITEAVVDTKPTCGNMMSGVGHLAIERGWVKPTDPVTKIRIFNLNTETVIETRIETPGGQLNYIDGTAQIDGVPGTAAPVWMDLLRVGGGATGNLFPLGRTTQIQGIDVSMVDAGNLMILMKAEEFGLDGTEGHAYFDQHPELWAKLESIRLEAGQLAGLGDVSKRVLPRMSLLSRPRAGGTIKSQYFTPWTVHPTHAVSGAVSIGTACKAPGTIAYHLAEANRTNPEKIIIEHLSGVIPVEIEVEGSGDQFDLVKASTLRTVRKLMDGDVYY
ncbi:MAG: PrpF domain-containing protein [Bacteroidota bacterium]